MLMPLLLLPVLFLLSTGFHSDAETPDPYEGRIEMNGLMMKDFANFETKWPLVTVRYREDNNEMRFTYANEIALKALKAGVVDYPDGAVFAKIGFISERDSAFASSIVPSGAKRYQFMMRDKKKFVETDGWGYALFNGNGQTFRGEPKGNSMACAACHRLVPQRGEVFSQLVNYSPFVETAKKVAAKTNSKTNISYETRPKKKVAAKIARLLPSQYKKVRWMTGDLQKNIFEGTAGEIGPLLAAESLSSHLPAVLASDDGGIFAFAYQESESHDCGKKNRIVVGRSIVSNKKVNESDEAILKIVSYCAGNP